MTSVSIQSTKGKVSKNMGFLKFYNWQMLCWVVMSHFTKQHLSFFSILINYIYFRLLVILKNLNKIKY